VYQAIYDLLLKRLPPEAAHTAGFWLIRTAAAIPGVAPLLRRFLAPRDPALRVHALGLDFPGPLGLAAGFDKDGIGVTGLAALGFAFVEVGTVTAQPQPGNPKPRMFRFPEERALVNRMGFNNHGAAALAARLRALRARAGRTKAGPGGAQARPGGRPSPVGGGSSPIIGVNIGKTKAVPEEDAIADYVTSATLVADVADYIVVNVSSPNTPGLRDLQAADKLLPLLRAVRDALDAASPQKKRSLEVLRRIRARTGDSLVLIAAGGIENADDARERLDAGATLVQAYTAFIYQGPFWPRRVHDGLACRRPAGKSQI
jgi:dihydroorotate dehydrogenase